MRILYFSFDGLPTSANNMYHRERRGVRLTDEARAWKEMTTLTARIQMKGEILQGYVGVEVHYFFPRRRADLDNRLKALQDALNGVVWVDDSQIVETHTYKWFVRDDEPHVDLTVWEVLGDRFTPTIARTYVPSERG